MRIPNLSTAENITETIRRMDQKRLELEAQVSSGQKITLPEDDGMRMGRIIKLDTEKSTLTQYRRNASYATEYLNAGHLNLDKLREVVVRAQEIARVAGSGLNSAAMETYGFEVDQLIEEALNRINASHRKRSLFGGKETTPDFTSSDVRLGKRYQKTLSLRDNYVGNSNPDGKRELGKGDEIWVDANGHEYVLKSKVDGFTTDLAAEALATAINNDVGELPDVNKKFSEAPYANTDYEISVRNSRDAGSRNKNVQLTASTSLEGDLILVSGVDQPFVASAQHVTKFDLQFFYPAGIKQQLDAAAAGPLTFDEIELDSKKAAAKAVFESNWSAMDFTNPNFPSANDFFPKPSRLTLDRVAASQPFPRAATQADIDAGRLAAIGDQIQAIQVDVDAGKAVTVGEVIPVDQDHLDQGRAIALGDTLQVTVRSFNDLTAQEKVRKDAQVDLAALVFEEAWQNDLSSVASYSTTFGSDYYFPKPTEQKLDAAAASQYNGKTFKELAPAEKDKVALQVFGGSWERDLTIKDSDTVGTSKATLQHPSEWKRLSAYQYGDMVTHEGKLWRSRIDANWNHKPDGSDPKIWEEVPSAYDVEREDWKLTVSGTRTRDYWMSPDGKMFDLKDEAVARTREIIVQTGYVKTYEELTTEIDRLTKRVTYAVPKFSANGSETSDALVAFNARTQEHVLLAPPKDGSLINGTLLQGEFTRDASSGGGLPGKASLTHQKGDVIFSQGRYYLAEQTINANTDRSAWQYLGQWEKVSDTQFVPPNYVGQHDPLLNKELKKGQHILIGAHAATQAEVDAGKFVKLGDRIAASQEDVGRTVAIGDMVRADQADVDAALALDSNSTLKVGDFFPAAQAQVDQGRIIAVGEQFVANQVDVDSQRSLAIGDLILATQADVDAALLANPASTLQVGQFFAATAGDLPQLLKLGDRIKATATDVGNGRAAIVGDLIDVTETDLTRRVGLGDEIADQYYVATADLTVPTGYVGHARLSSVSPASDGNLLYLGETLPIQGNEKVYTKDRPLQLLAGEYFYDSAGGNYYVAKDRIDLTVDQASRFDPSTTSFSEAKGGDPDVAGKLELVPSSFAEQGADWSPSFDYKKGQVVNYNGKYYQCLRDNWNNLALNPNTLSNYVVLPSDEYISQIDEVSGEIRSVANYAWASIEKPLGHVLKFSVEEEDTAVIELPSAGAGGTTAKAKAMVDSFGNVVGMRVLDQGRYFSGTSSQGELLPPDFDVAEVLFPDGQKIDVDILWYRDFTDPGVWKISGFDFKDREIPTGINSGPQKGDTYSFATGSKTFLDHRDDNGTLIDMSYNGSDDNAEFYIGHKSKISSLLEADNKGTEELSSVVSSLVDLRDALRSAKPATYAAEVEAANQKLISLEDRVVDKMGELSAKMVRMETVKSHDEDYYMEIDQRVSRDLDVDLSEAIMRLMRASTAYQASLQVGAQLINTSLLNYL